MATVFAVAVTGYRLAGYPWIEAVWMVVITIASVGYGERSTQPPIVQLMTIGVILFGFAAAAYTFGGLVQLLLAGELELILGRQRMTREINKLDGHTIVVGLGRIGSILAADLNQDGRPFVVIEKDANRCLEANERGYLNMNGNATDDEVLIAAGVGRARSLISALPNDADNVFITLTARNLNRDLLIVSRAEHTTSERKLRQAGANRVAMRHFPPGKSTMSRRKGLRKSSIRPALRIEQILKWADQHFEEHGRYPNVNSGQVIGTLDETWRLVDEALCHGYRGLPKKPRSSLAQLLERRRGVRNSEFPPKLTPNQIAKWAQRHFRNTGKWPRAHSGAIADVPGETWMAIDMALRKGRRDLGKGSSLAKFLHRRFGVRNLAELPRFTIQQILAWAYAHRAQNGQRPAANRPHPRSARRNMAGRG